MDAIKILLNSTVCPNFRPLPGNSEDAWEKSASHFACCDYEEGCPFRDHCPAIPNKEKMR